LKRKPRINENKFDICPDEVDPRILTDPYYYTFFRKLNNLRSWPKFGSLEHESLVANSITTENKFYTFNFEHYEKIATSTIDFMRSSLNDQDSVSNTDPNSKLNHLRVVVHETGEEYKEIKEKYPEYWNDSQNQASTSQNQEIKNFEDDREFLKIPSYDLSFKTDQSVQTIESIEKIDYYKTYNKGVVDGIQTAVGEKLYNTNPDIKLLDSGSTFSRRIRGVFNTNKKDETITQKSVHFIDDLLTVASGGNEFENSVDNQSTTDLNTGQMSQPPAPPASPTTVAAQDSKTRKPTSLFDALSNIKNIQLKSVDEPRIIPELSSEEILKRNAGKVVTSSVIKNELIDKALEKHSLKDTPFVSKYSVTPDDCNYTVKPISTTEKPKGLLDELSQFDANSLKAQEIDDKNKKNTYRDERS
jgi:hypothetical protein